ncbi:MAG TPA: L,D-transpeptidase [Gaiellaceae bacterium]|nr:L,D-transpeptidase [Gaiellaceae bacterium]
MELNRGHTITLAKAALPIVLAGMVSHGCIRMQVADSEWLFTKVKVGTTVFIV